MTVESIVWQPRYGIWIALQEDGESQTELAFRMGWEPSKLSRIITGKTKRIDLSEWEQIAEAQGRPLSWYRTAPGSAHNPRNVGTGPSGLSALNMHLVSLPAFQAA